MRLKQLFLEKMAKELNVRKNGFSVILTGCRVEEDNTYHKLFRLKTSKRKRKKLLQYLVVDVTEDRGLHHSTNEDLTTPAEGCIHKINFLLGCLREDGIPEKPACNAVR